MTESRITMVQVRFETGAGFIDIEVNAVAAPRTAGYVIGLIERGEFDNTTFHRAGASFSAGSDELQIIEGGLMYRSMTGEDRRRIKDTGVPLLDSFETTDQSGIRHVSGTVSLARDLSGTGHAIPDIFICLRDCPDFDVNGRDEPDARGFPAFGRVLRGMEVVQQISRGARGGLTRVSRLEGQMLTEPVPIHRAYRVA